MRERGKRDAGCDGAMLKQMKSQSASSLQSVSAAIFTQDDTDGRTQFSKGVPGSVLLLLCSSLWICFGPFTRRPTTGPIFPCQANRY